MLSAAVVIGTLRGKMTFTTAADDNHKYFFHCFSEKIRLDISCESSAGQRIHKKHQALFSSKDKSKKLKNRLQQFLFDSVKPHCNFISNKCGAFLKICSALPFNIK